MLKNVKSVYISKIIFSYLDEMSRLKTIKRNKKLQNLLNISLYNYQIVSGRYIIYETNEIAKEYDYKDNLIFEGEYLKGRRNGEGIEYYEKPKLKFVG